MSSYEIGSGREWTEDEPQQDAPIRYWYECQERAFAPGIGDGWPTVIKAPHTRNARLVRRAYPEPTEELIQLRAALTQAREALELAKEYAVAGQQFSCIDKIEEANRALASTQPAPETQKEGK